MSAIYVPTTKRDKKKIIQKTNNIPVAVIYFDVITIEGENKVCQKIRGFYEKLFERFSRWVNEDFERYAKKCYDADTNPRKRYRYNPIELKYVMKYEVADEKFLVIDTVITLLKGNNAVSEKRLKHIWNLQKGTLHTQKNIFNKKIKKHQKEK